MVTRIERQHTPPVFGIPHGIDGVRRLAELLAIVDQAHVGPHERNRKQFAVHADVGNTRVIAKAWQLLSGVADTPRCESLQQTLANVIVDFSGVGRYHIEIRAAVGGYLAAQDLVAAHQGHLDLDLVAALESVHHIAVGVPRPRKHPQRALLG